MLLLARFAHTAHVKMEDIPKRLFLPYQAGFLGQGWPRQEAEATRPLNQGLPYLALPYEAGCLDQSQLAESQRNAENADLPRSSKRRFYLILHAMFLDFHLFHVFYRNAPAVKRFREVLKEQDVFMRQEFAEYYVDGSGINGILTPWV